MKLKLSLAATLIIGSLFAQAPEYGPAKGTLVIQGGGASEGTGIVETFINKAGGLHAKIIVVLPPGQQEPDGPPTPKRKQSRLLESGAHQSLFMLHTHDPKVAHGRSSPRSCTTPTPSGSTADASEYRGLLCQHPHPRNSQGLGARGGVIGGSSAGATIQGDYLGAAPSAGPEIVMTRNLNTSTASPSARSPSAHINTRNRWDDIISRNRSIPTSSASASPKARRLLSTGTVLRSSANGRSPYTTIPAPISPGRSPYFVLSRRRLHMKTRTHRKVRYRSPEGVPMGCACR